MICSKCGTEFPDESEFCWKCGTKVVKDDFIFCWKCGNKLPADCEFCNKCGIKQRNGNPTPSDETINAAEPSVNTNAAPEDTTESSAQPRQENAADTSEPDDMPEDGESNTRSPDDLTGIEFMCMTKAEIKRLQGKQASIAEMSEYLSRLVLDEGALIHKNLRVGDSLDKASAVFNIYLNRCISYCGDEAIATFYFDTDQRRIMLEFKLDSDFKILQAVLTGEPPVPENQRGERKDHEKTGEKTPLYKKIWGAFYSVAISIISIALLIQFIKALAPEDMETDNIAEVVVGSVFLSFIVELLPLLAIGVVLLIVALILHAVLKKKEAEENWEWEIQHPNAKQAGQQSASSQPGRSGKNKGKKMLVVVIIVFAVSVVISIILGSGACVPESKAITIVKNSYFEHYTNETIGDAFDNFFGAPVRSDFTTENGEHIVQCRGFCTYNGQNATMIIRIYFDDRDYSFLLYSITIDGMQQPNSAIDDYLSQIYTISANIGR